MAHVYQVMIGEKTVSRGKFPPKWLLNNQERLATTCSKLIVEDVFFRLGNVGESDCFSDRQRHCTYYFSTLKFDNFVSGGITCNNCTEIIPFIVNGDNLMLVSVDLFRLLSIFFNDTGFGFGQEFFFFFLFGFLHNLSNF